MSKTKSYISSCLSNDSVAVKNGAGKNIIPPPEKESLWKQYLEKFKDPIIVVLLVVFLLSCVVAFYEFFCLDKGAELFLEPLGVLVALLLATGVAFIFELKAGREFEILNKVKDARPVKVLRRRKNGEQPHFMEVEKCDVVVGDIVRLESGDEIPADGYLIESTQLRVDESNFTGELYSNKSLDKAHCESEATYPCDFLLRGSIVIEGNAVYRVEAVGMETEEGKGVAHTREGSDVETPLNKQLNQLSKIISIISFVIAGAIVVSRLTLYFFFSDVAVADRELIETLEFVLASVMIAVTLIVVAVPEGLPMSVTVSLALSMRKMLKEKNLVRKLHACETMGATTVICTDKTGTLTKNQMTVVEHAFYGDETEETIRLNIAVNSTAELFFEDSGFLRVIGNPTEGALLKWLHEQGGDYGAMRAEVTVLECIPFSTETKYMSTTIQLEDGVSMRLIKGAPEIVMEMCDAIAGKVSRNEIDETLKVYQAKAMRTLAFACQRIVRGVPEPLFFTGVVAIADPVRDDVKEAIDTCRNRAGVRVIIVTGDTPGTANEIGRQIGLLGEDEPPQLVTGPDFNAMSDKEAYELVRNPEFKIISRARPNDKARLVTLLQQSGEVVAVTGDGTNDAPALSKAQVGLSMGDGTSRAKEASDITIIDNSFSSINKAIMWGRSLYRNIRRFIIFQMTINVCACLIVLLGALLGLDSPLTVTQMLWVNLIMDTFAAMALSSLPAEEAVLDDKPRSPNEHIINRSMFVRILLVGGFFFVSLALLWIFLSHNDVASLSEVLSWENIKRLFAGLSDASAGGVGLTPYEHAIFFSVFVMLQLWNLFNARYFRTKRSLIQDIAHLVTAKKRWGQLYSASFMWIFVVILLGQVLIVNYAGGLFGVEPLSFEDWLCIVLVTSPVLILPDLFRFVVACFSRKRG